LSIKKHHITIIFILIWCFSFSQQYTNFTTKDGLPSNHVYRIIQDYKGFLWFLTDKGMVKYNGSTFKTFTTKEGLPTNDIWDIRVTKDHKVWYFSKSAKLGYIKNDSVFVFESDTKDEILFPVSINQNKNKIRFSNGIKTYELKNHKWINTMTNFDKNSLQNEGIYINTILHKSIKQFRFSIKKDFFDIIDYNDSVLARKKTPFFLKQYHRGQINDSIFCWIDNTSYNIINLNTLEITSRQFKTANIPSKFVRYSNSNNGIQLSGENFVTKLDHNLEFTNYTSIPEKFNSHFSFIDKNDNIWITTFSNGVYLLPKIKQNVKYVLNDEKVGRLQTLNNKLIANVYNKGFYQYDSVNKKFKQLLNEHDYIFNTVKIDSLNTEFYITNSKIIGIKNNSITEYYNKYGSVARDLIYANGYLYGTSSFGVNKIHPKTLKIIKSYKQNGARDLIKFNNKIIIATTNGLKKIENDSVTYVFTKHKKINKPVLSLTNIDDKTLIVCTDGFGAYVTDLKNMTLLKGSDFLSVQSAYAKNNSIWLATSKGVWHYKKTNNTYELIRKYTVNDGLCSNLINSVALNNNNIIASSNDGITIIPVNHKQSDTFLNVYFNRVLFNNKPFNNEDKLNCTKNNHLAVSIAAIDYSENNRLNYEYQLLPIQKKWITTNSKQITFNNLQPKSYILNIKSHDKINSLKFKILPLWYQTIIAKILFFIIGLGLLIGIILIIRKKELSKQVKKLNAQKKLAEYELHALRSQMNPHFVFNSLAAIQYYINENNFKASETYLVKFSKLIRQFFELSKQKEINLKDEIKLLSNYLDIEKLRFRNKLTYKVNIDDSLITETTKIPTMLLQPIVENAVNHGIFNKIDNGHLIINFKYLNVNTFKVEIIDNGVGFVNTQKKPTKKVKSSQVLNNRIHILNQSGNWFIEYETKELHPEKNDKGNQSIFTIKHLE
jgi:hypothetical protein